MGRQLTLVVYSIAQIVCVNSGQTPKAGQLFPSTRSNLNEENNNRKRDEAYARYLEYKQAQGFVDKTDEASPSIGSSKTDNNGEMDNSVYPVEVSNEKDETLTSTPPASRYNSKWVQKRSPVTNEKEDDITRDDRLVPSGEEEGNQNVKKWNSYPYSNYDSDFSQNEHTDKDFQDETFDKRMIQSGPDKNKVTYEFQRESHINPLINRYYNREGNRARVEQQQSYERGSYDNGFDNKPSSSFQQNSHSNQYEQFNDESQFNYEEHSKGYSQTNFDQSFSSSLSSSSLLGGVLPLFEEPRVVKALDPSVQQQIFEALKNLYRRKVKPLEVSMKYAHFHSAPLTPADFDAKPMVLVVGGYSVGKTSFIQSLVGRDIPGCRIGPEPTTDRFTAIMCGDEDRIVPGHALAMQGDKPFQGLSNFGNNFLTKFEGAEVAQSSFLGNVTLIDTPGVLSGEKQRLGRDYDFTAVMNWFVGRADMIIVLFDAHKLDISDELKSVLDLLKPHQDKVRVLLNKADSVSPQQLMRVYGALMWQLGKVINTPEVCRVFISSFWERHISKQFGANTDLLEQEKADLLNDLTALPRNAALRRINELVKRTRSVKVHAHILHYLRKQIPFSWGRKDKQKLLISRLDKEFLDCARRYNLPIGDFPDVNKFRKSLLEISDISKFPKLDKAMVREMDRVLSEDVAKLLEKCSVKVDSNQDQNQIYYQQHRT